MMQLKMKLCYALIAMLALLMTPPLIGQDVLDANSGTGGNNGGGTTNGNTCTRCQAVNKGSGNGSQLFEVEGCQVTFYIQVYVANLNQGDTIVPDSIYTLPSGHASLYLESTNSGQNSYYSLNSFRFSHYAGIYLDIPVFVQEVNLSFSIADQCVEGTTGFTSDIELRLVTPVSGAYNAYPMGTYSGITDIFSCQVFAETCSYCPPDLDPCPAGNPNEYEIQEYVPCGECRADPKSAGNQSKAIRAFAANTFSVAPNPFSDHFELSYELTEAQTMDIELLDTNGKVLQRMSFSPQETAGRLKVNTSQLPSGLYYG
ncbi:MAG: T9SS type A sorting domain-containing protein, partial [Bacteroidota bacterium]